MTAHLRKMWDQKVNIWMLKTLFKHVWFIFFIMCVSTIPKTHLSHLGLVVRKQNAFVTCNAFLLHFKKRCLQSFSTSVHKWENKKQVVVVNRICTAYMKYHWTTSNLRVLLKLCATYRTALHATGKLLHRATTYTIRGPKNLSLQRKMSDTFVSLAT